MIWIVLAWLAAIGCVVVSARRLRTVTRLAREAEPAEGIERASRERLLAKLPADSALGRVAREVLEAPNDRAAVALLNEALSDVARELDVSREVPKSATRVALASGALTAIVDLALRIPVEGAMALRTAGGALAAGLIGATVCLILGRSAENHGRHCRDGWDRLGRALERLRAGDDVGKRQPVADSARVL